MGFRKRMQLQLEAPVMWGAAPGPICKFQLKLPYLRYRRWIGPMNKSFCINARQLFTIIDDMFLRVTFSIYWYSFLVGQFICIDVLKTSVCFYSGVLTVLRRLDCAHWYIGDLLIGGLIKISSKTPRHGRLSMRELPFHSWLFGNVNKRGEGRIQ